MELNDFKAVAVTGERLGPNQPLDSNLRALANQPAAAIEAFGVEWAGWCAASVLDRLAAMQPSEICIPWPSEAACVKASGFDAGEYYSRDQVQEMFRQSLGKFHHG